MIARGIADIFRDVPGNDFGSRELQGRMDVINNNEGIQAFVEGREIDPNNLVIFDSTNTGLIQGLYQCMEN